MKLWMVTALLFFPAIFFSRRVHDGRLTTEIPQWESIRFTLDSTITWISHAWEHFHFPFWLAGWSFPGRKVSAQFHAKVPGLFPSARLCIILCFSHYEDSHFQTLLVVPDEVLALYDLLFLGSDTDELPQPFPESLEQRRFCIFSMYHRLRKLLGTSCIQPLTL